MLSYTRLDHLVQSNSNIYVQLTKLMHIPCFSYPFIQCTMGNRPCKSFLSWFCIGWKVDRSAIFFFLQRELVVNNFFCQLRWVRKASSSVVQLQNRTYGGFQGNCHRLQSKLTSSKPPFLYCIKSIFLQLLFIVTNLSKSYTYQTSIMLKHI